MAKRKTTDLEKSAFKYLNELRSSGITNMFGADPYLAEELDLDRKQSKELLLKWMKVFNKEGDYEEIEE